MTQNDNNKSYEFLSRKDINNKMISSLEKTKGSNNEHAFDICSGRDAHTTDIEEGNEYHVDIRNKCPVGTKSIGNFHTHVHLSESNNEPIPSSGDMMETIERDLDFVCIMGSTNNKQPMRCFDQKNIKSEINTVLTKAKLAPTEDNIRKSARTITKKMIRDRDYLNKMSSVKM